MHISTNEQNCATAISPYLLSALAHHIIKSDIGQNALVIRIVLAYELLQDERLGVIVETVNSDQIGLDSSQLDVFAFTTWNTQSH